MKHFLGLHYLVSNSFAVAPVSEDRKLFYQGIELQFDNVMEAAFKVGGTPRYIIAPKFRRTIRRRGRKFNFWRHPDWFKRMVREARK